MEHLYSDIVNVIDKSKVLFDEPMKKHTTMKVGGNCDVMVLPTSIDDVSNILKYCKKKNINWKAIGNGSNLLVKDDGIRGVVIKLTNNFSEVEIKDNIITALSGMNVPKLSYLAKKNELTGLEFACGIPGSVGGCVRMNAGAYDSEMSNVVIRVKAIDENGNIIELSKDEVKFSYRHSIFSDNKNLVILSVEFKLEKGNFNEIDEKMKKNNMARQEKQPLEYPSAGSIFKRPSGYYVGKLVSDSGLRGYTIGGAQVSTKHTGFIINKGNATCKDVLDLIDHIKNTVFEKYGVMLQTEVEIIGGEN